MSMYTEAEAKRILDKVIELSQGRRMHGDPGRQRSTATSASRSTTSRPAASSSNTELAVQVAFGKRVGTATINEFDDASLERVVRRAEELARLAPENPEFMPAIGKQTYKPTADLQRRPPPTSRRSTARRSRPTPSAPCQGRQAGRRRLPADSAELRRHRQHQRQLRLPAVRPACDYTCTVRTDDGRGSGWVGAQRQRRRASSTPTPTSASPSTRRSGSADAKALEPGKYTVILEPAAAAGLISFMMSGSSTRARPTKAAASCPRRAAATKLGEQVFDPRVSIWSDPWDPDAPVMPWDGDGLPREKTPIDRQGQGRADLDYSRYWAQKKGKRAIGSPGNLIMAGGDQVHRRTWSSGTAEGHPGHPHLVHPHGRSADGAADRPDPRRHLLHRERRDQVPGEELPLQRDRR